MSGLGRQSRGIELLIVHPGTGMPRSLQTAALSFGLVNIPIRLYTAARSKSVSFHLLHRPDSGRIRYQPLCEVENKVVEDREEIVKGYEVSKGRYVEITDEELDALEAEANRNVEIFEFVPLDAVDPVYFEKTYYLGPDRGGERPYRLLADAMQRSRRAAIAQLVRRGKEELVMIRPAGDRLILNVLYYADEVRDPAEIEVPEVKSSDKELELALKLIDGLAADAWRPERYRDTYRERVLTLIEKKEAGETIAPAAREKGAPVVDLVAALKQSLDRAETSPAKKRRQRATA